MWHTLQTLRRHHRHRALLHAHQAHQHLRFLLVQRRCARREQTPHVHCLAELRPRHLGLEGAKLVRPLLEELGVGDEVRRRLLLLDELLHRALDVWRVDALDRVHVLAVLVEQEQRLRLAELALEAFLPEVWQQILQQLEGPFQGPRRERRLGAVALLEVAEDVGGVDLQELDGHGLVVDVLHDDVLEGALQSVARAPRRAVHVHDRHARASGRVLLVRTHVLYEL